AGAHLRALGEVINLGSGQSYTIRHTAERIISLSGSPSRICHDRERPAEVRHLLCDATRARALLGWAPRVGFEQALLRSIRAACASAQAAGGTAPRASVA